MFTRLVNTFKNYGETIRTATSKKESESKKAHANYINTRLSSELAKINEEFTQTCLNAKLNATNIIEEEFNAIAGKIEKAITKAVDPEFLTTLEVLNTLKEPSQAELEAIMNKYSDNYFCYRAICDALGGKEKGFRSITLDDVRLRIAEVKSKTLKALDSDVNEYTFLTFERGTAFTPYKALFECFVEGRFDEATKNLNPMNPN